MIELMSSIPTFKTEWDYTFQQWHGMVIAGLLSTAISLSSNMCVLITHVTLMILRPYTVNRVSLRMIVVSCICNIIFCVSQLATDNISNHSKACRSFAYVLISTDTMACMCLTMVGLNLVMIFVFKIPRSNKIEIAYYFIVILSGIIVTVVPLHAGTPKGPRRKYIEATCWYHFYFEGRIYNIFNWMWYYGCLMFSSFFAALFAAISIRYVFKKQKNFSLTLNNFVQRKKDMSAMYMIRKYTNNNTDIFQKIARRCVCYPLVPLISKSWGIGIEIAIAKKAHIPYPIFVLDRLFACLFGFMVACIYFTDPAIVASFRYCINNIKKRYVYDYFCVKYQPASDKTIKKKSQYPTSLEVIFIVEAVKNQANANHLNLRNSTSPSSNIQIIKQYTNNNEDEKSQLKPNVPTIELLSRKCDISVGSNSISTNHRVIKVESKTGDIFVPNEAFFDEKHNKKMKFNIFSLFKLNQISIIPIRYANNSLTTAIDSNKLYNHVNHHEYMEYDNVHTFVSYKYPRIAKLIHWVLITIFRVKYTNDHEFHQSRRGSQNPKDITTRSATDSTDNLHPTQTMKDATVHPTDIQICETSGKNDDINYKLQDQEVFENIGTERAKSSTSEIDNTEINIDTETIEEKTSHASLNIVTLETSKLKNKANPLMFQSNLPSVNYAVSQPTSPTKSSPVLTKVFQKKRAMSLIWNRSSSPNTKSILTLSPKTSPEPVDQPYYDDSQLNDSENDDKQQFKNQQLDVQFENLQDNIINDNTDQHNLNSSFYTPTYPVALRPRPRSQYKTTKLIKNNLQEHELEPIYNTIDNNNQSRSHKNPCIALTDSEDQLKHLDKSIYEATQLLFNSIDNLDDKRYQLDSDQILMFEETETKPPKSNDTQVYESGFQHGITTVNHISNWQLNINDDEGRVTGISESWDLLEQLLQEQVQFEDDVSHI